jgi:hypothetical protein
MKNIMNYITNARSMNGIITLTDGVYEIEDGNITTDDCWAPMNLGFQEEANKIPRILCMT